MSYTPGPWDVQQAHDENAEPRQVFHVLTEEPPPNGFDYIAETWDEENARLIAAAPDLLEAAKKVAIHARLGDLHPKDFQNLRAAIRKAEGDNDPR